MRALKPQAEQVKRTLSPPPAAAVGDAGLGGAGGAAGLEVGILMPGSAAATETCGLAIFAPSSAVFSLLMATVSPVAGPSCSSGVAICTVSHLGQVTARPMYWAGMRAR